MKIRVVRDKDDKDYIWIIREDNIADKVYKGSIAISKHPITAINSSVSAVRHALTDNSCIEDIRETLDRYEDDEVTPLTVQEYILLNNYFMRYKLVYNKRKDILITISKEIKQNNGSFT